MENVFGSFIFASLTVVGLGITDVGLHMMCEKRPDTLDSHLARRMATYTALYGALVTCATSFQLGNAIAGVVKSIRRTRRARRERRREI